MRIERRVERVKGTAVNMYVLASNRNQLVGMVESKNNVLKLYLMPGSNKESYKNKPYQKLVTAAKRRHGISDVVYTEDVVELI